MQKQVQYIIRGMRRDLSISKAQSEYSFENKNIRITARDHDTLLSITNERGNKEVALDGTIGGTIIGHCILNEQIVLFVTTDGIQDSSDAIYRIDHNNSLFSIKALYTGNLGFSSKNPLETLAIYENEDIQKVYWVDGINQPRVINIVADSATISKWDDNSFDFVRKLNLNENINIVRNIVANGIFAPGVLQYAFSYYNKYGQESNIFYVSPLYYVSYNNRGASPEDKVGNSFDITINNIDTSFDYIRVYSIHRTSIDATPSVRRVVDLATTGGEISYTDNGTSGDTEDPVRLLYIGGEEIVSSTITHKDNTLFLGNIKLSRKLIDKSVIDYFKGKNITFTSSQKYLMRPDATGYYPYDNQLKMNSHQFKTFKYLEYYRFGAQLQHITGRWSEPIWINDAQNDTYPNGSYISATPVHITTAQFNLRDKTTIDKLIADGFVKIRPLVVYPTLSDRECICQGILCPTVYNVEDRFGNSPFAQSSWFTRPNAPFDLYKAFHYIQDPTTGNWGGDWEDRDYGVVNYTINSRAGVMSNVRTNLVINSTETKVMDMVNKGTWAEFRHNHPIPSNGERNAEIQCIWNPPDTPYINDSMTDPEVIGWVSDNSENYYIDQSILTLHSPDIEFDDNVRSLDTSGLKLRIVGMVPMTSFIGDIDIQTSTPTNNYKDTTDIAPGFYKEPVSAENISRFGFKGLGVGAYWFDDLTAYKADTGNSGKLATGFVVYPFHRNGSLNNTKWATDGYRSAMLDKKKISNLRYSYNSLYFDSRDIWNAYKDNDNNYTGISGVSIFDSNEINIVRLPAQKYSGLNEINYYGNVDKVVTISRVGAKKDGYPIMTTGVQNTATNSHLLFSAAFQQVDNKFTDQTTGVDPVRIKYKSTPHAVLALNYTRSGAQRILPTFKDGDISFTTTTWDINYSGGSIGNNKHGFWDIKKASAKTISQDVINYQFKNYNGSISGYGPEYGWLWLGELYNDNVVNRFGGQTEEAFENNEWLPCGEPTSLLDDNNLPKSDITIEWVDGDTYYQRYDHIKTYPFTLEDQNAITDIVSFMCETRINIDGRYDRNRGQLNNFAITPENFNKLNDVYSQKDNFFVYRGLNHDRFDLDQFPNSITWSNEKQLGELVDTWTNITMASTLDLDGDKGEVISLNTFNNEIYCFQKHGFSNILFNSRVQVPVSDGTPIEITNGLKVGGKRYLSNHVGCNNKWSIVESQRGIYFIDNYTNGIYLYNGQISTISDNLGFRQWINENNRLDVWNPVDFGNFIGYYDRTNDDIYFIGKDICLCYSELLKEFTSFMSYENVPIMFNMGGKFYSIKNGKIWEQNAGEYNMFYGEFKPYYMLFRVNPEEPMDKTFNTIEFRSDTWDNEILTNETFDTLDVWNEYQSGSSKLKHLLFKPSSLKKKFRIWRANIPRDSKNNRDRMRNTWLYLKLSMQEVNKLRTEFHDLVVTYFE